jgi:soluble lytic murein transglycosylase-like protein
MCRSRTLRRALLMILAVSFLCETCSAQTNAPQLRRDGEAPFASVNESLFRVADSALSNSLGTTSAQLVNPVDYAVPRSAESRFGGNIARSEALIESILAREGVPVELSAIVKVESSGNRFAVSQKGARGLWQLMPGTARRYGLQVDSRTDERIDLEKSTAAAARYLRNLYAQFGSWPLALAAYNTGESNLQRAINRAQSNQFEVLSLLKVIPAETRSYVPAVLANITSPFTSMQPRPAEPVPANMVFAGTGSSQEEPAENKR